MVKITAGNKLPKINATVAAKVLEVVDAGLSRGMGSRAPGQMCVEAAVCYAMGEPHSDMPRCVLPDIRCTKIEMNDHHIWDKAGTDDDPGANILRSKALRRLAIAQLGSKGKITAVAWEKAMTAYLWRKSKQKKHYEEALKKYQASQKRFPKALAAHVKAITKAAKEGGLVVKHFEFNGAGKPNLANYKECLATNNPFDELQPKTVKEAMRICEDVVQILIKLKSPGTKYLYLTEKTKAKKRVVKRGTKKLAKRK